MPAAWNLQCTDNTHKSDYYCPLCGQNCISRGMLDDNRPGHEGEQFELFDCPNNACKLYLATTTVVGVESGSFASRWKFTVVFNYKTGEPVEQD